MTYKCSGELPARDFYRGGIPMNDLKYANLCAPGMMSLCTGGSHWKDQQMCKFYTKASVSNRCMYFRESLGSHCDCMAAQIEIRKY